MSFPILAGWISGVIAFAAFIPYIRSILRRETTPNRATWCIWTFVSSISLCSFIASGEANDAVWYLVSDALAPFIVVCLSYKYGVGGWSYIDRLCILVACIGLLLWWLSGSPLTALYASVIVDCMGAIPTIIKAYRSPESEDCLAWTMTFSAIVINFIAIDNWHSALILIYPVYMFLAMGSITFLLWLPMTKRLIHRFF